MALTAAERAKKYRDGKRDGRVTKRDESVTEDGSVTVETLAMVDKACGDKLSHGIVETHAEHERAAQAQSYNPMMVDYVPPCKD